VDSGLTQAKIEAPSQRFWQGHGLWRFPNFFRSVYLDAPQLGIGTASHLHFRRLTIERAARQLPAIAPRTSTPRYPVYFMSGREHWAMTAFCAFSLLQATEQHIVPVVMDDGTLGNLQRAELQRVLPEVEFLDRAACDQRVQAVLPEHRYRTLHAMRRELPLMRKLMDLHAGLSGWRLFLDSDMLFLRDPRWMTSWLQSPGRAVFMRDCLNSYGYSTALIESTLGGVVEPMVNTGFCGLQSDAMDWERIEQWAQKLHHAAGTNHFSEQCLVAMWMTVNRSAAAPAADYVVWPSEEESRLPTAAMHHYVDRSRTWYHIYGWPGVLRRQGIIT
jgi:hypothetical protein